MRAARQSSAHRRRLAAAEAPGTLSPPWRGGLGSGPPWGLGNEKQPTPCCALPFDCPGREAAGASPCLFPHSSSRSPSCSLRPCADSWGGGTGTGEGLGGPRAVLAHPRCCKHLGWLQASSWVHPRARSWPRSPSLGEVLRQPGWKGEGRGSLGTESPPRCHQHGVAVPELLLKRGFRCILPHPNTAKQGPLPSPFWGREEQDLGKSLPLLLSKLCLPPAPGPPEPTRRQVTTPR